MKKSLLTILLFLGITEVTFSQTTQIVGIVLDQEEEMALPFATVQLKENQQKVKTDLDGVFELVVEAGEYQLQAEFEGYQTAEVHVNTKLHQDTIRIYLVSIGVSMEGFVVRSERKKSGVNNLLMEQRTSASVSDGISAEEIKKKPDNKTSDVLKRISGASIQDNKFVVIRGLNDRYNSAYINGAPLPSSESDRKAFSFDIFPSNILDNIVIHKTATADKPGEFAGGIIHIETKNPSREGFHTLQIGSSYNTLTTFKNYKHSKGGNLDFLAVYDKDRDIAKTIPSTQDYSGLNNAEKARFAKDINPNWTIDQRKSLPNLNLQYALGKSFDLKKQQLSFVFAYAYQKNESTNRSIRREFEQASDQVILKSELNDTAYTQSILNTALLNFKYIINTKNTLSFKNIYSLSSEDKVTIRNGVRELDSDPHTFEKSSNRWYTHNQFYSSQLVGKHKLNDQFTFNWIAGLSDVQRNIPNMRRIVYHKNALDINDPNESFQAVIQNNGTIPTAAGNMFWSKTSERIYSASYDLTYHFNNQENKLKIGGYHQLRDRDFSARNFGFSRYNPTNSNFDHSLLSYDEGTLFSDKNMGLKEDGLGGFKLDEATKVSDSYTASSKNHAAYAMIDIQALTRFRIVAGARLEAYQQNFNYVEFGSNQPIHIDTTVIDVLPSINMIYSITEKSNLRFSFSNTVSRPEFRELAPFAFYNYTLDNILSGNPNLKRALIHNLDLRYENYPSAGQVFSISGFYKRFNNPIELINRPGTSGASELYYTNIDLVQNFGVELEYRVNLASIFSTSSAQFFENTNFFTNASLIKSKVNVENIIGQGSEDRPLQGQSPYILNAGLSYENPTLGFSLSASYNVVGRRIFIVGNTQEPHVWEKERHMIDLQFAQKIKKNWELKLNIRDLIAQDQVLFQDLNGNKKYDVDTDNRWQEFNFGQTISLSLAYKIK